MQILQYKILREFVDTSNANKNYQTSSHLAKVQKDLAAKTGISSEKMKALAQTTSGIDLDLKGDYTAKEYRTVVFSFVEKQPFRNFHNAIVRRQRGARRHLFPSRRGGGRTSAYHNQVGVTFITIFDKNECYFFPYTKNIPISIYYEDDKLLKSYFKIKIFKKENPTEEVDIKNFFETFDRAKTLKNTFEYQLSILSNFDNINKEYNIDIPTLLELSSYDTANVNSNTYYITFNDISKKQSTIPKKANKSTSAGRIVNIKPKIVFDIPTDANLEMSLNNLFNGLNEYTHNEIRSASVSLFAGNYYESTFRSSNQTIRIFTRNKIFNTNSQVDCFVTYGTSRKVPGKLQFVRINP